MVGTEYWLTVATYTTEIYRAHDDAITKAQGFLCSLSVIHEILFIEYSCDPGQRSAGEFIGVDDDFFVWFYWHVASARDRFFGDGVQRVDICRIGCAGAVDQIYESKKIILASTLA